MTKTKPLCSTPLKTGVVYPGKFLMRWTDVSLPERELELDIGQRRNAFAGLALLASVTVMCATRALNVQGDKLGQLGRLGIGFPERLFICHQPSIVLPVVSIPISMLP